MDTQNCFTRSACHLSSLFTQGKHTPGYSCMRLGTLGGRGSLSGQPCQVYKQAVQPIILLMSLEIGWRGKNRIHDFPEGVYNTP